MQVTHGRPAETAALQEENSFRGLATADLPDVDSFGWLALGQSLTQRDYVYYGPKGVKKGQRRCLAGAGSVVGSIAALDRFALSFRLTRQGAHAAAEGRVKGEVFVQP